MTDYVVGVLGGGQLGLMLSEAANRLEIKVAVLDKANAPAKQINVGASNLHVTGSFAKAADVRALAANCDVMTYEIEHVDTKILEELEEEQPFIPGTDWARIQPSWKTIRTIQDKYVQKEYLSHYGIATAPSIAVGTSHPQGLKEIADQLGYPMMVKSRTQAYDGRGNYPVRSAHDIEPALKALSDRPLYAEKWANFKMELAVMVVKTVPQPRSLQPPRKRDSRPPTIPPDFWESATLAYSAVETVHEDSICKLVYAPARNVSKEILLQAQNLARQAVSSFPGCGVFGVEMFLLHDDTLIVNEIAPRPHNSGHYTIEACRMSQYEAHLNAILPSLVGRIAPDSTSFNTKDTHAVMLNILGGPQPAAHHLVVEAARSIAGAKVFLYGKGAGTPGRKMGHVTLIGSSMYECETRIQPLVDWVDALRAHRSDASSMSAEESKKAISATVKRIQLERTPSKPPAVVGVTMGSDSDLKTLAPGLDLLDKWNIAYEVRITSAHRTPDYMMSYASSAASRGLQVLICAAGGAAHLPGMSASKTALPVIGIPVQTSTLSGVDSLYSIVQMPRGVPVATVAIGNSVNAALLAARIVGINNEAVREQVEAHMQEMERENRDKDTKLQELDWRAYQEWMGKTA